MGDILHTVALLGKGNSLEEGLLRHIDQPLCLGADGTTGKGCCTISMKSLVKRANVYGDDIAFFEDVSAGDAVDNHLVDGDAGACRETV